VDFQLKFHPNQIQVKIKKTYNTHIIVNSDGNIVTSYQKIHLFDVNIVNQVTLRESNQTQAGDTMVSCDTPIGRMGVTVCYDVRFPELYATLRRRGKCEIFCIPAAFTVPTGNAHWHTLIRARAIENQCYVIAAAQIGKHDQAGKRITYGHALVVDPWGTIIAETSTKQIPGYCLAEIDLNTVKQTRTEMPLDTHERCDIYNNEKKFTHVSVDLKSKI